VADIRNCAVCGNVIQREPSAWRVRALGVASAPRLHGALMLIRLPSDVAGPAAGLERYHTDPKDCSALRDTEGSKGA